MRINTMKLQKLRKDQGLSPQQLARKAGVTPDTVLKLEHGARDPHPSTVTKIARALGVPLATLADRPADDIPTHPPVAGDIAPGAPSAPPQDERTRAGTGVSRGETT